MYIFSTLTHSTFISTNLEWYNWRDADKLVQQYNLRDEAEVYLRLDEDISTGLYRKVMDYPANVKVVGFVSYIDKAKLYFSHLSNN